MVLSKLLKADRETQLEWLKSQLTDTANEQDTDIITYIHIRAWDEPLGAFIHFDQSRLDDMLGYPEAYDLGESIQNSLPDVSNQRAKAINAGSKLTPAEREVAVAIFEEGQADSDAWISCSGFTLKVDTGASIYIAFSGASLGQGGIDYAFYGLFSNSEAAINYFSKQGDNWFDI